MLTGIQIYALYLNHPQFIEDWKITCVETDGCSTSILKYFAWFVLKFFGSSRKYKCLCHQHDFDYRYGSKYGMTQEIADNDLSKSSMTLGNTWITDKLFTIFGWCIGVGLKIGGKPNFRIHDKLSPIS